MIVQKKVNKLQNKNYILNFNKTNDSFYLEETSKFKLPKNLYQDFDSYSNKVLTAFNKLNKNQGVLLSGFKGSGKSIGAKNICIKSELPVLIINQPFSGDGFNSFVDSINQEVVLFFDEFEKTYRNEEDQERLLTLMDGVFDNKVLFLFTVNSTDLNEFFFNRPSRIRYNFKFDSISNSTLRKIVDDLLKDKSYEDEIIKTVKTLGNVGVDLVISLIEEVNIFNKSPLEVLNQLNIRLEASKYKYIGNVRDEYGKQVKVEGVIYQSPLSLSEFTLYKNWKGEGVDYSESISAMLVTHISDKIHIEDRKNNNFTFTPIKEDSGINNLNKIR